MYAPPNRWLGQNLWWVQVLAQQSSRTAFKVMVAVRGCHLAACMSFRQPYSLQAASTECPPLTDCNKLHMGTCVTIRLLCLAAIEGRPELAPFKELLAAMYAVFSQMQERFPTLASAAGYLAMALVAMPDWVAESSAPALAPSASVAAEAAQPAAQQQPASQTAAPQQYSRSAAGGPRVSFGLGYRAMMPGVSVSRPPQGPLAGATVDLTKPYMAAASRRSVAVSVVGMSYFPVGIQGPRGRIRKSAASLDTGCSINSISEQYFLEVCHHLLGPDSPAQLCELESPVTIGLFAGSSSTVATHCVTGVPLHIGKGVYTVDFLIVKGGNFNMVLGNNFLYDYAGRVWCRDFNDRQAGRFLVLPLPERLCQPGVSPPQPPPNKGPHWYPSQRVPINYEVCTDTWQVKPVSSYTAA